MKTWLRGGRWEVQPGQAVHRFQIQSDKFDENELILPLHLTAEGFPTIWGPAHAFATRLNHSLLRFEKANEAYGKECRQAALDLITLVVAQFLGLLKHEEIPLGNSEAGGTLPSSRLLRLMAESLSSEARQMPALIVLRDPRLANAPIAAINYPDCLWFPVHSYRLDVIGQRIEDLLGRIELQGLTLTERRPEEESRLLVGQLRKYLHHLIEAVDEKLACSRVLAQFEHSLQNIAHPASIPIRSGKIYTLSNGAVRHLDLHRSGEPDLEVSAGCPECGQEWMNHSYSGGPLVLEGGASPKRQVICPRHNRPIAGWDDLMERSVFFEIAESEYVIWGEDPSDGIGRNLRMPPNGERVEITRGSGPGRVRYRFNRAEVEIRGRVVKLGDVLLRQVVELPSSSNVEALPINGDEAVCVDWEAGGVKEDKARRGYWNVHLRGGWRPLSWQAETFRDPDLSEPENVTLLLWPGFDDPGWKAETVVYGFRKIKATNSIPAKVRCYRGGPRRSRLLAEHEGRDIKQSMLHLAGRVDALELRSPGNEPWGYLLPKRRTPKSGQVVEATVALDFGTSNTAIAWKPAQGNPEPVSTDQEAQPVELMAPSDSAERQRMAQILSLLPFWPKQAQERWYVPSELLFFPESGQWTIPHDAVEPAHFESMDLRRDFKWFDEEDTHRRIYLSFVLRMALANLRALGIQKVRLRATYPLAFERGHLAGYAAVLQQAVDLLAKETGMEVSLVGYANESISGMEACGQKAGQLQCVIDFGGGTTDMAVRILDPERGFTDPLFADSIRLAGNDILDSLLADRGIVDALLQHGKASLPETLRPQIRLKVARQIVMRELRGATASTPPWWRYLADRSSGSAQRFAVRNRAYFDGVLAYILKLLAAAQDEMRRRGVFAEDNGAEIAIFLLGQGWGLLRLQVEKGDFEPKSYVQRRLQELQSRLPGAPSQCRFQVIAPGYEVRSSPKLATSFGAVELRGDHVRPAAELENKTGRDTIFGLGVEFYDKSRLNAGDLLRTFIDKPAIKTAVSKHDAWDQFVGPLLAAPGISDHVRQLFGMTEAERRTLVENRLTDLIDKHMAEQLAKSEILQTSPLLLLIERVWAEQLKRVDVQVP